MDPYELVILLSITLILSYVSSLIHEKTKIPDLVWLIILGIIVGPVLEIFPKNVFVSLAHFMSIIALSVILFEAGLDINLKTLLKEMGKASVLSISTIVSVTVIVGIFISQLLPESFSILQGTLLGAIISGSSTVVVLGILSPLSDNMNIEDARTMLVVESVLSDPIRIILSVMIIRMIMEPHVLLFKSLLKLVLVIVSSTLLGIISGTILVYILTRLRSKPHNYMVTLAVMLSLYSFAEKIIGKGGGPIVAITFGLTLSNFNYLADLIEYEQGVLVPINYIKDFHDEITFFIESFFFVYIGIIVTLSIRYAIIGIGILLLKTIIRYIIISIVNKTISFSVKEEILSKVVYSPGLPAFVMSQLPLIYDPNAEYFSNPGIYPDLVLPIVLSTVILNAITCSSIAQKRIKKDDEK